MIEPIINYLPLLSVDMGEIIEERAAEMEEKAAETMDWIEKMTPTLIKYGKLILMALILFLIGRKIIKLLTKGINKTFKKAGMEAGLCHFLNSLIRLLLNLILIVILAGFIGIETSSLVAVIGSAGLAIGLALQGSLSNFAGGVLILVSKPFVVGDYIVTPMGEGTVTEIGIVYTSLCTADNRVIVIPNGTLSNSSLTNVSAHAERMLDLEIGVSYDSELKKVMKLILDLINGQDMLLKDRDVNVFVKEFGGSSINIGMRFYTSGENYWNLKWKFQEELKEMFDKEGIEIPYKHVDVHVIKEKE